MAKNDNLKDFLTDVADAIREKKGTSEPINPQDFSAEIASIETGSGSSSTGWTGHADVEGLKAIGWTDDDIAYYQKYGVNWDEEDDEYHKVSDANKELYGVVNINNAYQYADDIEYLPKIDTAGEDFITLLSSFREVIGIPMLDYSSCGEMLDQFSETSIVALPPLAAEDANNWNNVCRDCHSLVSVSITDCRAMTDAPFAFENCYSLVSVSFEDTSNLQNMESMFQNCYSLQVIKGLDVQSLTSAPTETAFAGCYNLKHAFIKNIGASTNSLVLVFQDSPRLSKESVLYMINNNAGNVAGGVIGLHPKAYARLANDEAVKSACTTRGVVLLEASKE